jgi:hypothetical protein
MGASPKRATLAGQHAGAASSGSGSAGAAVNGTTEYKVLSFKAS